MIHEILEKRGCHPITGRELAKLLGCDIRSVTSQVELERRSGVPICATTRGEAVGYFLPKTPDQLETYCRQLYHRGSELFATRRALIATLENLKDGATGEKIMQDYSPDSATVEKALTRERLEKHSKAEILAAIEKVLGGLSCKDLIGLILEAREMCGGTQDEK